jgi:hypothetical protein
MINWKGFWKEAVVVLSRHFTGEIGKYKQKSVAMDGIPAGIRTEHLPNYLIQLWSVPAMLW